jgi:hypothetical protein
LLTARLRSGALGKHLSQMRRDRGEERCFTFCFACSALPIFEIFARCKDFGCGYSRATAIFPN